LSIHALSLINWRSIIGDGSSGQSHPDPIFKIYLYYLFIYLFIYEFTVVK